MTIAKNKSELKTMPELTLNDTQKNAAIGAIAGSIETAVTHPIWAFKTRLQNGDYLTLNPKILYRGFLLNAATSVPIAALLLGTDKFLQKICFNPVSDLSTSQKSFSAFGAGALSASIICPIEMVMTWQGRTGKNAPATIASLRAQGGIRCLFNGFTPTLLRDGTSGACLLALMPTCKKTLRNYTHNDSTASLASGMLSGLTATVLTQGIDTIKTTQQSANPALLFSFKAAFKKIKTEQGFKGFNKGFIPRSMNMACSITVMGSGIEFLNNRLSYKTPKPV